MAVSRNCKNGSLSPMGGDRPPVAPCRPGNGRQGPFCNFFLFFLRTGPCRGTCRGAGHPPPTGDRGAVAPPQGDRAGLPYLNPPPFSPLILFSKIPEKNRKKKRGVRRRKAAKPCRSAHLWSAGINVWPFIVIFWWIRVEVIFIYWNIGS